MFECSSNGVFLLLLHFKIRALLPPPPPLQLQLKGSNRDPKTLPQGEVFLKWELTSSNRYLADFWVIFSFECQTLCFIKSPIFHFLFTPSPTKNLHLRSTTPFVFLAGTSFQRSKCKHISQQLAIDMFSHYRHTYTHTHTHYGLEAHTTVAVYLLLLCTSYSKGQKSVCLRIVSLIFISWQLILKSVSFQCWAKKPSTFTPKTYIWGQLCTHIYLHPHDPQHSLSEIQWLNKHSRLNYLFVFMIYFILTLQLNGFPICPTCCTTVPCPWAPHFTCQHTHNEVSNKSPHSYERDDEKYYRTGNYKQWAQDVRTNKWRDAFRVAI